MSIVKHEEEEEKWKGRTRIQQHMSICILTSFAVLLLSAVTFIIAVGTVSWYSNDENLSIGVWQYCVLEHEVNWKCYICVAGRLEYILQFSHIHKNIYHRVAVIIIRKVSFIFSIVINSKCDTLHFPVKFKVSI